MQLAVQTDGQTERWDRGPPASLLAASSLGLARRGIVVYVGDVRVRESPLDLGGGGGGEGRR